MPAGLLVEVAPYTEKYTVMRDYYNSIDPGILFYASNDDGAENTEQNLGIKLFQDLFARKDSCNIENSEDISALFEKVKEHSRDAYKHSIEKKSPDKYVKNNEMGTDIGDIMKEYMWGVISGSPDLSGLPLIRVFGRLEVKKFDDSGSRKCPVADKRIVCHGVLAYNLERNTFKRERKRVC